jgi:hypothetical protein
MAADLERWAGVGGAQVLPWALRYESGEGGDKERQILECLGAAVVSEWNKLLADVQRDIFQHAAANKTYDPARLKAQFDRFSPAFCTITRTAQTPPKACRKSRTVSRILGLPDIGASIVMVIR